MQKLALALEFEARAKRLRTAAELERALAEASRAMGFRYFALVHHVDTLEGQGRALRIHNYPESFSAWFDANRFARLDPVHRACHQTSMGFSWSTVAGMIRLGQTDLAIFQRARDEGIGNGFTVPAHVPGESRGSCSFAVAGDAEVPHEWFPVAQLIGVAAFEAARCLNRSRRTAIEIPLRLTERQRDCVLWAARGKTDWEIARILGVSRETVRQHLRQARERYGIQKRSQLAVRALYDGVISFNDVLAD